MTLPLAEALLRQDRRQLARGADTRVDAGNVIVRFATVESLEPAEARLPG